MKELWQRSLLFRRVVVALTFALAAVTNYLGSNIARSVALPMSDLNEKAVARLGQEALIVESPAIGEGDLALSYQGSQNEVADLWLEGATLDSATQQMFFPKGVPSGPTRISYTTNAVQGHSWHGGDTCHTVVEVRRAHGSAPVVSLKLYQDDWTAGAQRFRQVVMNAGDATLQILVHTDAPAPNLTDLAGCRKLLTVGGAAPVELPLLPVRMLVTGGTIDLHFNQSNPAVSINTGENQTFEAVSLGEDNLRATGLKVLPNQKGESIAPKLEVRASPKGSVLSIGSLKLGSEMLRVEVGQDQEEAKAFADGTPLYKYDLSAVVQQNQVVTWAVAAILVPLLGFWVKKSCFPGTESTD